MAARTPRSPLRWYGSKAAFADQITAHLGEHRHYVEVFAGGASVLFAKPPSRVETLNDLDDDVIGLFAVLADPATAAQLTHLCHWTPYSRRVFHTARAELAADPPACDAPAETRVRRAWAFLVAINFSVSHTPTGTGFGVTVAAPTGSINADRWIATTTRLTDAAQRLRHVQIEHADWRRILDRYDRPTTAFYCDPPYHPDTRGGGSYRHELDAADHDELVATLLTRTGHVVCSGYDHPAYQPLVDAGWARHELATPATRRRGNQPRDMLWVKPAASSPGE